MKLSSRQDCEAAIAEMNGSQTLPVSPDLHTAVYLLCLDYKLT